MPDTLLNALAEKWMIGRMVRHADYAYAYAYDSRECLSGIFFCGTALVRWKRLPSLTQR